MVMKKLFVFLLIVAYLISGCSFNVEVITPAPGQSDITPPANVVASPIATISATAELPPVGFTPVSSDPVFFGAYVALEQDSAPGRSAFPAGTKQVFGIWNYQNMQEGLTIKREWYLDGKLWLTREEPWDFARYGAFGIIRDISIYDFEVGLPSGIYQLRLYINDVIQPIGFSFVNQLENQMNFEILPIESITEAASPNFLWDAVVLGGNRLIVRDTNGIPSVLFAGLEIPYFTWLSDSQHLLFVDRDRSGQLAGTTIGIRDTLWIVDILTQETQLLYKSETALGERGGLSVSPDGRYVASVEGSGYGDACIVDSKLIFFEVASDYKNAKAIKQEKFTGIPASVDGVVYPVRDGIWQNNTQYLVTLDGTCSVDKSKMGPYLFNVSNLTAAKSSSSSSPLIAGDLGWGTIHGMILDSVTHAPVGGAIVSCEHHSYTSPVTCSGTTTTNVDGIYIFDTVFFHDTDTVKLTVQANGYQEFEYTQNFFSRNDLEANISVTRLP